MTLSESLELNNLIIKAEAFFSGLGKIKGSELEELASKSLFELASASKVAEIESRASKNPHVSVSERAIAEMYLKIHDEGFISSKDIVNLCDGFNQVFKDTVNGHALMIDGFGAHTLIELTSSGDDVLREVTTQNSSLELMKEATKMVNLALDGKPNEQPLP